MPIESFVDEKKINTNDEESAIKGFSFPNQKLKVYEIWKVFLEENEEELNYAYVVISADLIARKYKSNIWKNVEFRGFYTTLKEAKNEINGYLR